MLYLSSVSFPFQPALPLLPHRRPTFFFVPIRFPPHFIGFVCLKSCGISPTPFFHFMESFDVCATCAASKIMVTGTPQLGKGVRGGGTRRSGETLQGGGRTFIKYNQAAHKTAQPAGQADTKPTVAEPLAWTETVRTHDAPFNMRHRMKLTCIIYTHVRIRIENK